MSERQTNLYLSDIIEAIEAVEVYVTDISFAEFMSDRKTYAATIRELEIIGEASAQLPDDLKLVYPEIPWRLMKDFRNILIHHYFRVNFEVVWDVVLQKLPLIKKHVALIHAAHN